MGAKQKFQHAFYPFDFTKMVLSILLKLFFFFFFDKAVLGTVCSNLNTLLEFKSDSHII